MITRLCPICETEYTGRADKKTCSPRCRKALSRQDVTLSESVTNVIAYQTDQITVYHGDFRGVAFPENSFFIFDPPYNIGFNYDVYQDNLTDDEYIKLISEFRGRKVAIIQYPEEMQRLIVPALGAPLHTSVWCYNSNTSRRFRLINWYGVIPDYSLIKQPYKNPTDQRVKKLISNGNGGANLYEWWDDIQIVKNVSKEKTAHPCPIPEKLIRRIITLGAVAGDIIVDPFAGSLTTLKAARDLGYQSIGCELSESYIREGIKRLEHIRQLKHPVNGQSLVKQYALTV